MLLYIAKRFINLIPLLLGITIISFIIIHLAPGSPTDIVTQMNPKVSFEAREKMEKLYGFDKPLYTQYFEWLKKLARFDFGKSFIDGRSVTEKIIERMPITLFINILSIMMIFLISIPIGVRSALHRGSLFDKVTTVLLFLLFAAPGFWLALILMSFFGLKLGWLPISGITSLDFENMDLLMKIKDVAHHLILPVFVAGLGGLAGISRYTRERMLHVINEDYVRTAKAKGLPEKTVIYRHALRNALLPIITIIGLSIPGLISGSVIFESVFNIPGMGRLMVEAVFARDYNVIMGGLVISAILTLIGNLIADIAYSYADPRIRYD